MPCSQHTSTAQQASKQAIRLLLLVEVNPARQSPAKRLEHPSRNSWLSCSPAATAQPPRPSCLLPCLPLQVVVQLGQRRRPRRGRRGAPPGALSLQPLLFQQLVLELLQLRLQVGHARLVLRVHALRLHQGLHAQHLRERHQPAAAPGASKRHSVATALRPQGRRQRPGVGWVWARASCVCTCARARGVAARGSPTQHLPSPARPLAPAWAHLRLALSAADITFARQQLLGSRLLPRDRLLGALLRLEQQQGKHGRAQVQGRQACSAGSGAKQECEHPLPCSTHPSRPRCQPACRLDPPAHAGHDGAATGTPS